jgi:hypothetical protein
MAARVLLQNSFQGPPHVFAFCIKIWGIPFRPGSKSGAVPARRLCLADGIAQNIVEAGASSVSFRLLQDLVEAAGKFRALQNGLAIAPNSLAPDATRGRWCSRLS